MNLVEDEERMRQWVIFPGWGQCFDITDWVTGSTSSLQKNCATYIWRGSLLEQLKKVDPDNPSPGKCPLKWRWWWCTSMDVTSLPLMESQNTCLVSRLYRDMVFGRPFVKRFALCYHTIVCPVLSVCLSVSLSEMFVHCGQTVGWIKMTLGMEMGLGPGHIVLGGDPAPLPQKRGPT